MFERAIELDPHHAQSWAGLALSYMDEHWSNWTSSPEVAAERSFELAQKAVAVDERESRAHLALAEAYLYARRDFDRALIEIEKASDLNPNDYTSYCMKSWLLALDGRTTEGIACASTAFRLNPFAAYDCRIGQFLACYAASAYDDALTALQNISPAKGIAQACLAACYAKLSRTEEANRTMAAFIDEARSEIRNFPGEDPAAWREYWAKFFPFRATSVFDDLMHGMRDAGLPT
jgi:tetratricopeptide (TPR) repeat protein